MEFPSNRDAEQNLEEPNPELTGSFILCTFKDLVVQSYFTFLEDPERVYVKAGDNVYIHFEQDYLWHYTIHDPKKMVMQQRLMSMNFELTRFDQKVG